MLVSPGAGFNWQGASDLSDTLNLRLKSIVYAAQDTHLYEFCRPDGGLLPAVEPGAHIDIHLPNGMMRQYSLTTAEGPRESYIVGIKRDRASRGGSIYIHDHLKVGQIFKIPDQPSGLIDAIRGNRFR